jgi:Ca2+-dependent lipid-binding protein
MDRMMYGVRVGQVRISRTRPNGEPWDHALKRAAPDLRVELQDAGIDPHTTGVAQNSYEAGFEEPLPLALHVGEGLHVTVYNVNYDHPDTLIGETSLVLEEEDLAQGALEIGFDSVTYCKLVLDQTYRPAEPDPRNSPVTPARTEAENAVQAITVAAIRVAKTRPDGRSWDPQGITEAPDLRVELRKLGDPPAKTSVAENTWEHTFDETQPLTLRAWDRLRASVVDRDLVTANEFAGEVVFTLLPEDLETGSVELSFGSVETLQLAFDFEKPDSYQHHTLGRVGNPRLQAGGDADFSGDTGEGTQPGKGGDPGFQPRV